MLSEVSAVLRGMWTTFRSMFEKPVTYQHPEVKRPVRNRFRGRHVLQRYDNGLEKCIGCSLCSAACPADAIFVESEENTDAVRFSPGKPTRQDCSSRGGHRHHHAHGVHHILGLYWGFHHGQGQPCRSHFVVW